MLSSVGRVRLESAIAAIEGGRGVARAAASGPIHHLLACPKGLRGGIHEWFGQERFGDPLGPNAARARHWWPPIGVLTHVARRAVELWPDRRIVWIGGRCRPYLGALVGGLGVPGQVKRDLRLLHRSIVVEPSDQAERIWAIDLALRCAGVSVVIAEGSAMTMAMSRRLQLSAQDGGTIGLVARPPWERRTLSAARTRWCVSPAPSSNVEPRWIVELLCCKGVQPTSEGARQCVVQRDHETGDVRVDAHVADRPAAAQESARSLQHTA
ncbi:MAG: hypothetical protein KDA20_05050 [Phycisphaerales bacterium]|nr:hypothetical protein [Phycisphaerales bacterium]